MKLDRTAPKKELVPTTPSELNCCRFPRTQGESEDLKVLGLCIMTESCLAMQGCFINSPIFLIQMSRALPGSNASQWTAQGPRETSSWLLELFPVLVFFRWVYSSTFLVPNTAEALACSVPCPDFALRVTIIEMQVCGFILL